jgi:thiol-disulfide isomerase/thioredoxin
MCSSIRIEADETAAPANQAADEAGLKARIEERKARFYAIRNETLKRYAAAENPLNKGKIYSEIAKSEEILYREVLDMAFAFPKSEAARDAFLMVLKRGGNTTTGTVGGECLRAAKALLTHFGDDPLVISHAIGMDNIFDPLRDLFVFGVYATAKSHESKGLARLALAQYLSRKSAYARGERMRDDYSKRIKMTYRNVLQKDGSRGDVTEGESDERYAYRFQIGMIDPDEAERHSRALFDEVIRDYGDVKYRSWKIVEFENLLASGRREHEGRPLTDKDFAQIREIVARPLQTLAEMALARLDDWDNLATGKPVPEIDAEGVDGKRFKLSDYRGKVVVLIFWGTWCGPCMVEVPHEREMAEKYKDKPVALLGVNCDADRAEAIKVMKKEGITWPNWYDGEPGEGPIAKTYHIQGYPTVMVIDAEGKLRSKNGRGKSLEAIVDKLLTEMQSKTDTK